MENERSSSQYRAAFLIEAESLNDLVITPYKLTNEKEREEKMICEWVSK